MIESITKYFIACFEHQCITMRALINSLIYLLSLFMKNFRFNTLCNITQEPQELQRYNRACRLISKSAVINDVIICYQKLQVLTGDRFSTS